MRAALLLAMTLPACAEDFRLEITAGAWQTGASGTVQSGGLPIDVDQDLALERSFNFTGRLVAKPGRKHRIVVDGSALRLDGDNELARSIRYRGNLYSIRERVLSKAELNTVFAGYEYEFAAGEWGHVAAGAAASYIDATGTIRGQTAAIEASSSHSIGLPLATASFRANLIPGTRLLYTTGDLRGMTFGRYGRLIQGGLHAGVSLGRVAFQAGYGILDVDLHESGPVETRPGIAVRLTGPVFAIQFRDR